ncbi:hypothetical protein UFOVP129_40 [uncultured Caudovirales phage]|uniref:Uncharacterized protein n=1 Tax=uncultured Caudovirales phage TaxID=2100421 RepID=A0A6J5LCS5_9CAUD|nr:hypothetical protein UFOVP129_40 [uncultured Caudovirales phage]
MARPVAQIQNDIQAALVSNLAAVGITLDITQWSRRNMLRVLCFVFATATNYLEQLMDILKNSIETTASQAAAPSYSWIQLKMFLFQYSATTPQILQIIDTIPQYPVVDATLRIITGCAVTSSVSNEVTIKVAKGNPFISLTTLEKSAAQGYINELGSAGINYTVVSLDSDKIYINADIYFNGQYSSVISDNVIAALNSFLQNIATTNLTTSSTTNGGVKVSDLENVIRGVAGVNDVVVKNIKARPDTASFSAGVDLVLNQTILSRQWLPIAGYTSQETTSGKTFTDSLNFIAE